MTSLIRFATWLLPVVAATLILALPVAAQTREGLMGDLLKDTGAVEKKILALAAAMPESAYAWKPGPDVRSAGEVFQHVASDNYFIPGILDMPAPKDTGITKEYKTVVAFEKRPMNKAAVIAELEKSFAFLRTSMSATTDAQLSGTIDMFGQKGTTRWLWITTVTHLHEHLGQLIAYARANQITPPWSK